METAIFLRSGTIQPTEAESILTCIYQGRF